MASSTASPPTPGAGAAVTAAADRALFLGDLFLLGVSLAVVAASMVLEPSAGAVSLFGHRVPTLCMFRLLTGYRCPGCGLTRSFTFMGHGRLADAFHLHWLGPPLYLLVAGQVPYRLWRIARYLRRRGAR